LSASEPDPIPRSLRSCPPGDRRRPLIGLTTYRRRAQSGVWDVQASFLPAAYIDGVTLAGGIATLLPPQPVDTAIADRALDNLDGLVVTGGTDVDPAAYGQDPHPATEQPADDRDNWEFALLHAALRRGLPVLGICRGAQVLNVALGGTLHQHLPDIVGNNAHRQGDAVYAASAISTVPGSRLVQLVGDAVEVQCYHHQGIDRLGDGLVATATATDGVIEAVEMPGPGFVLAVQWHPEKSLDDLRLFRGLIDAACDYATGRAGL
jgi:putative glutamine amidotransferase